MPRNKADQMPIHSLQMYDNSLNFEVNTITDQIISQNSCWLLIADSNLKAFVEKLLLQKSLVWLQVKKQFGIRDIVVIKMAISV